MDKVKYTTAYWPFARTEDRNAQAREDFIVGWLDDLHLTAGPDSWRYSRVSSTIVEFRDPEDALAFKLIMPGYYG